MKARLRLCVRQNGHILLCVRQIGHTLLLCVQKIGHIWTRRTLDPTVKWIIDFEAFRWQGLAGDNLLGQAQAEIEAEKNPPDATEETTEGLYPEP